MSALVADAPGEVGSDMLREVVVGGRVRDRLWMTGHLSGRGKISRRKEVFL